MSFKNSFKLLFNTNSLQSSRLPWIDYAKGIAITLVVYRHVLIGFTRAGLEVETYLIEANEVVYSFRMPLFFVLSGLFIGKSLAKRSLRHFIINKLDTLFYAYLVWAFIQVSIQIILSDLTNANRGLIDYLYIFTQPREIDHLWFLFALFNVSITYAFLKAFLKLQKRWLFLVGIIFYQLSVFVKEYSLIHDLLYYFIFLVIGDVVSNIFLNKKNYFYLSSYKLSLAILPFFIFSQWYWLSNPNMNIFLFATTALIGCAFMLNFSFMLDKSGRFKFLRIIGYHSMYVYIMHVMLSSANRILFVKFFHITQVPILLFLGVFMGVIIPIMLYNLSIKLGFWFLYTLKKPAKKISLLRRLPKKTNTQTESHG